MRHGLEVRVPMLDEDLLAFGLNLPYALRANRRTAKIVLRGVAERRLPSSVVRRPKQGFAVPVDSWVNGDFKDNLRASLLDPGSRLPEYLEKRVYEPWVRGFCSDTGVSGLPRNHLYQRVVMLLALDLALKNGSQTSY
jgi:asparagine synthetase B (glutamine-hydrolysing)